MPEERIKKEKAESFINETFRFVCLTTKKIVLIRCQSNRKLLFLRNKKLINLEEFRNTVFKEFEDGIKRSAPTELRDDLEIIAKNVVNEIKKGKRPKLQEMLKDSYTQLVKESLPGNTKNQ